MRNIRIALVFPCLLAFAALRADDWPMLAHDMRRTGHAPESFQHQGAFDTALWKANFIDTFSSYATPIAARETVFISGWSGNIYALGLFDGRDKWIYKCGSAVLSPPCWAGGRLFVAADDGRILCLDADNGSLLWSFECEGPAWGSPLAVNGIVLAGDRAGLFYALDAESGAEQWRLACAAPICMSPASDGERVFFGSEDMRGHAVEIASGRERWTSGRMTICSFGLTWPVVAGGKAIFVGNSLIQQYRYYRDGDEFYQEALCQGTEEAKSTYIQNILAERPEWQSVFLFDCATGAAGPVAAALYNQGSWGPMAPPVVRDNGEVILRSLGKNVGMSSNCGWSRLDTGTGLLHEICPPQNFNWLDVPYAMSGCADGLFVCRGNGLASQFVRWGDDEQTAWNMGSKVRSLIVPDPVTLGESLLDMEPMVRSTGLCAQAVMSQGIVLKMGNCELWAFDARTSE